MKEVWYGIWRKPYVSDCKNGLKQETAAGQLSGKHDAMRNQGEDPGFS